MNYSGLFQRFGFFLGFIFIFSCKEEIKPVDNPEDSKESEMQAELARRDSTINFFIESMNQIEGTLEEIRAKQTEATQQSKDLEMQKTQPERIVEQITSLNQLIEKNKKTISNLQSKLKKANIKISEFEQLVERLTRQIDEKDKEISQLKGELENRNYTLKNLFEEYNQRVEDLGNQAKVMATAFYAFGSKKELMENGVITREGGFIGLGKESKLSDQMNKKYFTQIDIFEVMEITLSSKKAKLLTTHPKGSYRIEGSNRAEKLVIQNPEDFWSVSKYLVVEVE